MKIDLHKSRFPAPDFLTIESSHGRLKAKLNDELELEEHEGYTPEGYSKTVLELSIIEAARLGVGDGDALMTEFLNSKLAQDAELIFLDPNPGHGLFFDSPLDDEQQIEKLMRFYRKHGFRNKPHCLRMWRVQKGEIPDDLLPS